VGLLVCDFHLGNGEDAFDVIREVRARTDERLPVILVSGDTSSATARAADRIGACHRVSKPVDAEALIDLCHRLLERYWAERGCSDSPTFDDASRELTRFHGLLPTNGSGDLAELGGKVIDRIVERHYAD
jgi:DNA-binding NtrC family response regulator